MTGTRRNVLEGAAAATEPRIAGRETSRETAPHPDSRRHRFHRPAPGRLCAPPRPPGPRCSSARSRPEGKDWPGKVEELLGDRSTGDLKSLEGREWDVCIDNPTTLPFWVRDAARVLKGHVKQYIFISTISVYNDNDKPADETGKVAPYTGKDAFAETKVAPELYGPLKAISEQEAQAQFGPTATIIRPGLIVGPGDPTDRFTYWPVRIAQGGDVAAPGDGSDPVQFIDARDLAEWTIRMAETHQYGVYNATGPARTLTHAGHDGSDRGRREAESRTWCGSRASSSTTIRSKPGPTCRSGSPATATPPASAAAASRVR